MFEGEVEYQNLPYYTDIIAERAGAFVLEGRDRSAPWLLNLNFTTPHWPWEGPGDQAVSEDLTRRAQRGNALAFFHFDGGSLEKYREMVESLDAAVGRVLAALKRSGQLQDAVVLFASDNGGERFSYHWPFSGGKGTLQEGGIRVSTMLSWPGQLRARQVSNTTVTLIDWMATLIDLAGAQPDPAYPLDGTSLVGHLFEGGPPPERDLFWRVKGQRALRRGDLNYLQLSDGTEALHDLGADAHEQANLLQRRPDEFSALRAAWQAIDATLVPYAV